jgi:hypothetical protein
VLDGVLPSDVFQGSEMLKMTQGWLDALFQACTDDATCHAAYPELESVFYDTLTTLRNEPVSVTIEDESGRSHEVIVDDLKYANYVLTIGFLGDSFTAIPDAMMTIHNGDYETVAQGWLGFLAGRHGETGPGSFAWSMGLAITDSCLQEGTTGSLAQAMTQFDTVERPALWHDWAKPVLVQDWLAHCEYWNATPAPSSGVGEPIGSDVPTLMLVSTFDAATAPYFSDAAIEHFSHGYRIELPVSHLAAITPCGADLTAQFLADPSRQPETSCMQEMTAAWVLPE